MDIAGGAAVLIAADEEAVCFSLARETRRHGLVPLVAGDGVRAIELACAHPGLLIGAVVELRMPARGGLAVAAWLAGMKPTCPVVLMIAHHAALVAARNALGVCAILEKPFELSAFVAHLVSFLAVATTHAG